jgi:hypothetical protein
MVERELMSLVDGAAVPWSDYARAGLGACLSPLGPVLYAGMLAPVVSAAGMEPEGTQRAAYYASTWSALFLLVAPFSRYVHDSHLWFATRVAGIEVGYVPAAICVGYYLASRTAGARWKAFVAPLITTAACSVVIGFVLQMAPR